MAIATVIDPQAPVALPLVPRAGRGHIVLEQSNNRTAIVRSSATSPLKLLAPRSQSGVPWIFTSTYGGGLVGGDSINLSIDAGPETRCLLSTQASTKVYRTTGPTCRQELNVSLGYGAILVSMPDPLVCYARSKFEQKQRFDLSPDAGLVMLDWITSGRRALGERWAFDRYASLTEIFQQDRCVFRDAISLDPADGAIDDSMRMGLVDCFATIIVLGKPFETQIAEILAYIQRQPAMQGPLLFAISVIANGVVIRVAGNETESAGRWIRERLSFVCEIVGQDPWVRKW